MCAMNTGSLKDLAIVGIDLDKDTFHLVVRKQIKRLALNATFEQLSRCIVGMEACLSAHFVSRTLWSMGFEPRTYRREWPGIVTAVSGYQLAGFLMVVREVFDAPSRFVTIADFALQLPYDCFRYDSGG